MTRTSVVESVRAWTWGPVRNHKNSRSPPWFQNSMHLPGYCFWMPALEASHVLVVGERFVSIDTETLSLYQAPQVPCNVPGPTPNLGWNQFAKSDYLWLYEGLFVPGLFYNFGLSAVLGSTDLSSVLGLNNENKQKCRAPVSLASSSASNSPGRPTTFFLSWVTSGVRHWLCEYPHGPLYAAGLPYVSGTCLGVAPGYLELWVSSSRQIVP